MGDQRVMEKLPDSLPLALYGLGIRNGKALCGETLFGICFSSIISID